MRKPRPVQPCPSARTSPLTLQPDALGNHLEADDAVRVLLVFFQILPVVVKDERQVIVQVDLQQSNREHKLTRSQETTRKSIRETSPFVQQAQLAQPSKNYAHSSPLYRSRPELPAVHYVSGLKIQGLTLSVPFPITTEAL